MSPLHFACFRILLGALVAAQLLAWWPYAEELFAQSGLPGVWRPAIGALFPSPLLQADVATARAALLVGTLLALALALGVARRAAAVALWYVWTALGHASPLTQTVASAYVGWLLLATVLVPPGEPLRIAARLRSGRSGAGGGEVPRALWVGAWIVLAAGYGISGLDKLASPGWRAGDALVAAVGLPHARAWSAYAVLALDRPVQHLLTWSVVGVELLFPVLAALRWTRPAAWLAGAGLHLGLLALFRFPGLSFAMLLVHVFTFDPRWIPPPWRAFLRTRFGRSAAATRRDGEWGRRLCVAAGMLHGSRVHRPGGRVVTRARSSSAASDTAAHSTCDFSRGHLGDRDVLSGSPR